MDRQGERNVENTMSGNDMQNRCGLKDTQELRSPPEVDWQQPESPQGGLRYGIGVPGTRGVITPYTGLSAAQGAGRTLRGGIKWGIAPGIVLGFEATREPEAGFDEPKWRKAIEFRTELRW